MRTVKLTLWIFILYILQTVFCGVISVYGAVADLLLVFCLAYAFMERSVLSASTVIIICSVLNGSAAGRVFPVVAAATALGGIVSYSFYNYLRFIPSYLRFLIVVIVTAFVCGTLETVIAYKSIGQALGMALPYLIYTAASSVIIYPLLYRTIFNDEKGKKFIIQERN